MTSPESLAARRHRALGRTGQFTASQLSSEAASLFKSLVAYGEKSDRDEIDKVRQAYDNGLQTLHADERLSLWPMLVELIGTGAINAHPLLAMAICDPDRSVSATAALDFVCLSQADGDGISNGLEEFSQLFRTTVIANKGAVFGGLLALGDDRLIDYYRKHAPLMGVLEMREASFACRSARLFRATLDFWVWVCEMLADREDDIGASIFGDAAATLAGMPSQAAALEVLEATRVYPASCSPEPVVVSRIWSWEEFTADMADRMTLIAAKEAPPRIFPNVIAQWEHLTAVN